MGPDQQHVKAVPLAEAGGSPDHVREMLDLQLTYKFDWLRPVLGDDGPHAATWMTDAGPVVERRDNLRELILYVRAYFGRDR